METRSRPSLSTSIWVTNLPLGNGQNWHCQVQPANHKTSTHLVLKLQGELTLPLPGLMKKMIAPVVEGEFEKLVEQYIDNLTRNFGGEV